MSNTIYYERILHWDIREAYRLGVFKDPTRKTGRGKLEKGK